MALAEESSIANHKPGNGWIEDTAPVWSIISLLHPTQDYEMYLPQSDKNAQPSACRGWLRSMQAQGSLLCLGNTPQEWCPSPPPGQSLSPRTRTIWTTSLACPGEY